VGSGRIGAVLAAVRSGERGAGAGSVGNDTVAATGGAGSKEAASAASACEEIADEATGGSESIDARRDSGGSERNDAVTATGGSDAIDPSARAGGSESIDIEASAATVAARGAAAATRATGGGMFCGFRAKQRRQRSARDASG
jgi:hypothetical protein